MKIHIVTDSTSDIPEEYVKKYNINVVPLNIHFGDEVYKDGKDLNSNEFYELLNKSKHYPTTSQPSPGDFYNLYKEVADTGDEIISIHISSELSGTYQSAVMAKNMIEETEGIKIHVIDSRITCTSMGMLVLETADMVRAQMETKEISNKIDELKERIFTYFMVDTLKYLEKGGRIGKAQALAGNLLNIKPILLLEKGIVVPLKKSRGRKKGIKIILDLLEEKFGKEKVDLSVMHANVPKEADELEKSVKERLNYNNIIKCQLGPIIGSHAGPGTIGIGIYKI